MIHGISAPGLHARSYYHRFTEDHVDICDVLSSFSYSGKAKLDEISRVMGLPGKPDGIDGSQVQAYYEAGRIDEIADYCQSDVLNTYRIWLRYELFRGRLTEEEFEFSDGEAQSHERNPATLQPQEARHQWPKLDVKGEYHLPRKNNTGFTAATNRRAQSRA